MESFRMIIGGKHCDALSKETLSVISPVDGKAFTRIPRGRAQDVDAAVIAARSAFEGEWGQFDALSRGRLLMKLAQSILEHHEELAQLESRDTGKPLSTARADITVLARYFEYYGSAADKVLGEVIPYLADYSVQVIHEPLGVTAHIIPWNYPAQILGRSVAPAVAMGNATVIKPAEDACLSILRVAELALEVGIPAGVINVVTGLGEEAGAALSAHPGINFISFTGSSEVGTLVQQASAQHAVKCVLELGGKSAHVVFDDADLDRAAATIVRGIVHNAGQTCSAGSRVLLQQSIFDVFMEKLTKEFSATRVGSPEMDLTSGPVISRKQFERVQRYIELGTELGLEMVAQGQIAEGVPEGGFYVVPTLFVGDDHSCELMQEEIFGPVLVVMPFKDEAEAITLANDTEYGLLGAVWTENGRRQIRMAKAIEAGQVYVNGFGAGGGVELPFGGVKRSGHGREKGLVALEEMSSTKTIVIYHGE